MQNRIILTLHTGTCLLLSALGAAAAQHPLASNPATLASLVQQAVSTDTNDAKKATAALRSKGPAGLDALIAANLQTIERHKFGNPNADDSRSWSRLCAALDCVSAQRDSYASGLFWHTDFTEAKVAARASGKPILSLRLLGRLDEDRSCANSRFFRTTLYANAEVSRYLHDHFVLHWQSVRPVPLITVDFGDGRKIESTITGNSIHYILDADGHPVDALPGLYSPAMFLERLRVAETEALKYFADKDDAQLRQFHSRLLADSTAAFTRDLNRFGRVPTVQPVSLALGPPARDASRRTASKGMVERPYLDSFQPTDNDALLQKIAALHQSDVVLDRSALHLIESKLRSSGASELPPGPMILKLQRSIAEDTVLNEYTLHSTIHQWFATQPLPKTVDELNSRVYAELFLTPGSDPWLGLASPDTFSGLENNGLVLPTK